MALIDALAMKRNAALQFSDALRGRSRATAELVSPSTDHGRTCATVRVTFGDDDIFDVLIDLVSGESSGIRMTDEHQQHIERFGDWRVVDGIRMLLLETIEGAAKR